ncbi:hypothetical protein CC2G_014450 [Coprinopsis cinerea AmutBmut pab1-1]|nr:hypothetical protein CC2G_014450 [Coprinopsis cinerea AmutBmut pab1-1]
MRFFKPQVDYMKSHYPGFKKAQAAGSAPVAGGDTALEVFWKGIKGHFSREWATPQAEQAAALAALAAHNAANPKKKKTLPPSLAAERHTLSPEDLAKWKAEREEAVVRWFYNHDSSVKDSAPELRIELAPPKEINARALTKPQLYSKKYYNQRVMKNVNDAIAKMPAPPKRKEMIDIISKVTYDTFTNETPEILAEVDRLEAEAAEERQKMKDILKNAFVDDFSERVQVDEAPDVYCRHINALDTIFQGLLPVLAKKTGWSFSVICGGPDPMKTNGEIRTRSYHEGRSPEGLSFSKVHPTYESSYVNPYSAFLHMIYPPEVRQSRVVQSGLATFLEVMNRPTGEEALAVDAASAPKAVPENAASTSSPTPAVLVSPPPGPPQAGTLVPTPAVAVDPPSAPPKTVVGAPPAWLMGQPTGSMNANGDTRGSSSLSLLPAVPPASALSTSVGPSFLSGAVGPVSMSGGAFDDLGQLMNETMRVLEHRGGVDGPGPAAVHAALSLRPEPGSLGSELEKMGAGDYGDLARYDGQQWPELDGAPHAYQIADCTATCAFASGTHSRRTTDRSSGIDSRRAATCPASRHTTDRSSSIHSRRATACPASRRTTDRSSASTPAAQPPIPPPATQPIVPQASTPAAQPPVPPPAAQPIVPQASTPAAQPPIPPPATHPIVPQPIVPQPIVPQPTVPQASTPAAQPPAGSTPLGLKRSGGRIERGEGREKRPRKAAIGLEGQWVTGVSESLKMRVQDPRWAACVGAWVTFELARVVTTGRFPVTKARPVEIAKWAAKGGDHDKAPPIEDIDEFGARWCSWWNEVQPDWRKNASGTLPHDFDPSTTAQSLATLEKAGPKGIGMALQSLSWWAGGKDTSLWLAAVDDIHSPKGFA